MTKEQAKQLIAFEQKFKDTDRLYSMSTELTFAPFIYGDEINDFIQFCYDNNLVPANYQLIEEELIGNRTKAEWFTGLSEEEVIQCIAYFIRGDRFCDGLLASAIKDGTISYLLKRIKTLYSL
jgi:hypothetical protein